MIDRQCKQKISQLFKKDVMSLDQNRIISLDDDTDIDNVKNAIFKKMDERKIKIVFRGDNQKRIINKIFDSDQQIDSFKLFSHLYYFGGKAENFFKQSEDDEASDSISEDYGSNAADFLFNEFHKIMKCIDLNENQKKEIMKLRYKNIDFNNFFENEKNLEKFKKEICSLELSDKKEMFDYYFYLLHLFGKKGISKFTGFISTSFSYSTAEEFAKNKGTTDSKPFIYIYALDFPVTDHGICSESISYFDKFEKYQNLKRVKKVFFKNESELAIKRALFPHRIMAFDDLSNNSIILNPHFLNKNKNNIKNLIENGIPVKNDDICKEAKKYRYRKITTKYKNIYTNFKV